MTPGNISRRSRSEATQTHVPAAIRIDIDADGWKCQSIEIPHQPFDVVFHPAVIDECSDGSPSALLPVCRSYSDIERRPEKA
jgi:hypothetical protein